MLDAKSGPRFRDAQVRLEAQAKYLWLIHERQSGRQPVRQLFLVHRDTEAPPVSNLPEYFEGRPPPPDARLCGAIAAAPGSTEALQAVMARFLETFRPGSVPA